MQKLTTIFASLDPARRVFVALAAIGTFAAVLALARGIGTPGMTLLYAGLEPSAAGEVIGSLETMGVAHEVRGDAIFVDATRRDSLRLALAAEGKPRGVAGYEILDNLSGFGTTAQMFDAAYVRAKEGELARTIQSLPEVASVRVHIARSDRQPFARDATATASVMVTTAGGPLPAPQARAVRFLVASAVPGLSPDAVSVIDSRGGLIGATGPEAPGAGATGDDRAAALRRNVERLLAARVGPGRAIVEVNVDTVTEREEIVERRFDPDSRVAISTITEESTSSAEDRRDGAVTVAGNLPDGDAGGSGADSASQETGTREQINYEVSETQREVLRAPGAVRRLTVAVLVDGIRGSEAGADAGADAVGDWTPRSEAELSDLRELVASAVGFDADRGDVITIRSMQFPEPLLSGTEAAAPGLFTRLGLDVMRLVQVGVLAVVALVLGLFVVRPILTRAPEALPVPSRPLDLPAPDTSDAPAPSAPEIETAALPPLDGDGLGSFAPQMAVIDGPFSGEIDDGGGGDGGNDRLRELTDNRAAEAAVILQGWMEDREARA